MKVCTNEHNQLDGILAYPGLLSFQFEQFPKLKTRLGMRYTPIMYVKKLDQNLMSSPDWLVITQTVYINTKH